MTNRHADQVPVTGLTSLSVTERRVLEAIACGLGHGAAEERE